MATVGSFWLNGIGGWYFRGILKGEESGTNLVNISEQHSFLADI
jgi:hypothetical protein